MKRLFPSLLLTFMLSLSNNAMVINANNLIDGGSISFDFSNEEDMSHFDMYTSYYTNPIIDGDELHSYIYSEHKVILKDVSLTNYLIEADFAPNIKDGHTDIGFYLKASNPGNPVDHITAWNLMVKHDPGLSTYQLRLYQYTNNYFNGTMAVVENIPYWYDEWMHLSVLVKDGNLSAYIDNNYDKCMLTYYIGPGAGLVGIRAFRCPAKVRNLKITSSAFDIDLNELNASMVEAKKLKSKEYTSTSWSKLLEVLSSAMDLVDNPKNQIIVNKKLEELEKAKKELVKKKSYEELASLISESEAIKDEENYTKNSYQSLQFVISVAKELTSSSSEDDISSMYQLLENRKNELIRYGGK